MLNSKYNWHISSEPHQDEDMLHHLLKNRGITDEEEIKSFLQPELSHLNSPALLSQIDVARDRITQAIESGELILVYGDYDADGITSTAVMMQTLLELGAECESYIPNRFTDGYGLNEKVIQTLPAKNVGLLITVDTGIANVAETALLNELGIDTIITDHHEVQDELPDALAIVHPKLSDEYPFKSLAGVGVAFQLAHYLLDELPVHLLAYAAIGTVADLVPLQEDNRILVYYGLKALNANDHIGLHALIQTAGMDANKYLTERDIGFMIGPRLNAAGRIADASLALDLMLATEASEATQIAAEIEELNKERQNIVKDIVKEAEGKINTDDLVLMLYDENWHEGVLGIAASRLVKQYDRPVILLTYKKETNELKGSARSIPAFHMFDNGMACRELFTSFGGHAQAAGMTFPFENLSAIHTAFNGAAKALNAEDFKQEINHIERLPLENATEAFVQQLEKLAPFGMANEQPVFIVEEEPKQVRQIGQQNKHLKMIIQAENNKLDVIGFNFGELYPFISSNIPVSIVGKLDLNEWNGNTSVQLVAEDMAIDDFQLFDCRSKHQEIYFSPYLQHYDKQIIVTNDGNPIKDDALKKDVQVLHYDSDLTAFSKTDILYICDLPRDLSRLEEILSKTAPSAVHVSYDADEDAFLQSVPTREAFKKVYQYVYQHAPFELKSALPKIMRMYGWRKEKPIFMLKVFFDLAFIKVENNVVYLNPNQEKKSLTASATYQKRLEQSKIEQQLYYSTYESLRNWLIEKISNETDPKEEITHGL